MERYLPPIMTNNLSQQIVTLTGYAWAGMMFALGFTNLYAAANYSPIVWGYFLSIGATGAKIMAFFAQFLVLRALILRRLRAQAQPLPRSARSSTDKRITAVPVRHNPPPSASG
jgi:intracellular septation protein